MDNVGGGNETVWRLLTSNNLKVYMLIIFGYQCYNIPLDLFLVVWIFGTNQLINELIVQEEPTTV